MGLDKLRLVSHRRPSSDFMDQINAELALPTDLRRYVIHFRDPKERAVGRATQCSITTKNRLSPFFYLQTNCFLPVNAGIVHVLEMNPNNFHHGFIDLCSLIDQIFGERSSDLSISRMDLNADVEVPVDYFRRTLRIPRKRKSAEYQKWDGLTTHSNRGLTGFSIGRTPSLLRVYDKIGEMKQLKEDISGLPSILTRLEWELRHRRCPVRLFSEIEAIADVHPFETVQIVDTPEIYDFLNDPSGSLKNFIYHHLAEQYSGHQAIRILNHNRNFVRDFKPCLIDVSDLKKRLQASYLHGIRRFFSNQASDVRSTFERSAIGSWP